MYRVLEEIGCGGFGQVNLIEYLDGSQAERWSHMFEQLKAYL